MLNDEGRPEAAHETPAKKSDSIVLAGNPDATALDDATILFLTGLDALGIPLFVAEPGVKVNSAVHPDDAVDENNIPVFSSRRPDAGEFRRPGGWQALTAGGNSARLAAWRTGYAVCAVLGGLLAVVDVDPRNDGDVALVEALLAELGVRIFARIKTPGGGVHLFVAGHPDLPLSHSFVGYAGVDIVSFGGHVFLPGTHRPKYEGLGYTVVDNDLEAFADGGDPDGAEALAAWVAAHRPVKGLDLPCAPPWDGVPPDQRQRAYMASALARISTRAAEAGTYRNIALYTAGLKCGSLIAGAGMDEQEVITRLTAAAETNGYVADDGLNAALASIRSGLRNGKQNPRAVPEMTPAITYQPGMTLIGAPAEAGLWAPVLSPSVRTDLATPTRTSWWPNDMASLLAGTSVEDPPAYLNSTDGSGFFYRGRVNGLIGASESGKTWIALLAMVQALGRGEQVSYVDFEDVGKTAVERLRGLGVSDEVMLHQFSYIRPEEALDVLATNDLTEHLAKRQPELLVVDGVNAAMTLLGLDLISNTDATQFAQMVLVPISATGACVITVDHVVKSSTDTKGAIGAQAKRAMITGCSLKVDNVIPFGRGKSGKNKLSIDKDRPGHVRGRLGTTKAVMVIITANADGGMRMQIEPPDTRPTEERGPFRPTTIMERISRFLVETPNGASGAKVERHIGGNHAHVRLALVRLEAEGFIQQADGSNGATISTSIKPYNATVDG